MKRMKKVLRKGKKILSALVLGVLMGGSLYSVCYAAETSVQVDIMDEIADIEILEAKLVEDMDLSFEISPYTMLTSCVITARGASDGMYIDISTGVVGTASVLGVKDVKIMKKTWYGGWNTVAVSNGGECYNMGTMGINIFYANAVKDSTYRITCVHYGNVDGYIEGTNDSGEIYFTY